jgi:hypothetical protein
MSFAWINLPVTFSSTRKKPVSACFIISAAIWARQYGVQQGRLGHHFPSAYSGISFLTSKMPLERTAGLTAIGKT